MLIVTLVATLAAGMVWRQQQAVAVEAAERARAQGAWILDAGIDWARLVLREDARTGNVDHLGEPWATPLAEARLSTFLAADRENHDDTGLDAFLSGAIVDAQSRYNLRNLVDAEGRVAETELRTLQRLCDSAGVPSDTAMRIALNLQAAIAAADGGDDAADAPLVPDRVADLRWFGLDAETLARLEPYVSLLPNPTPLNVNTAAREELAAVIEGLDLASAERIVQARAQSPLRAVADLEALLPEGVAAGTTNRVGVSSGYFEVRARLRLDDRVVEERALVRRRGPETAVLWRERRSLQLPPA